MAAEIQRSIFELLNISAFCFYLLTMGLYFCQTQSRAYFVKYVKNGGAIQNGGSTPKKKNGPGFITGI
jgi:hypothetical protein